MAHVRKQLRDLVIAGLKIDVPAFGNRVDNVRGYSRNTDKLPAAEVSTPNEQSAGVTMDGLITRNIELSVVIRVNGSANIEDQCDALAVNVEKSVFRTALPMCKELTPESMGFEYEGEGETRVARMELSFSAIVQTFESDPETAV
jgi:hypothetical protein